MLAWFRAWRARRKDRARRVFQYYDGSQFRRIDPIQAAMALQADPQFDWSKDPGLMIGGDAAATDRTVNAVRKAFDVKTFEHGGLTIEEVVGLLVTFREYLVRQKKSGSGWLISPRSTRSESTESPPNTEPKPSSDCGSTSNVSSCEEPCPLSPESTLS